MAISKHAGKSVRPILISPQRRAEKKKIQLVKGHEMKRLKRVHFRIPKTKEQRSFAPLDASAREIQLWLIAVLGPLAWELWAFPFRLAFCDIILGNALFVYDVDVACDVVFVFDMIGNACYYLLSSCTCLFLSPVFYPLKLFHGGGTAGQVKKADDVCLLCKYFMAYAIPFSETHINISI